jgi:hypothetical protein
MLTYQGIPQSVYSDHLDIACLGSARRPQAKTGLAQIFGAQTGRRRHSLGFLLVLVIYRHHRCHARHHRPRSTNSDIDHHALLGMHIAISC